MEEMIAKIVEMDKKAREMNEKAQKTKLSYENEVLLTKEKLKPTTSKEQTNVLPSTGRPHRNVQMKGLPALPKKIRRLFKSLKNPMPKTAING